MRPLDAHTHTRRKNDSASRTTKCFRFHTEVRFKRKNTHSSYKVSLFIPHAHTHIWSEAKYVAKRKMNGFCEWIGRHSSGTMCCVIGICTKVAKVKSVPMKISISIHFMSVAVADETPSIVMSHSTRMKHDPWCLCSIWQTDDYLWCRHVYTNTTTTTMCNQNKYRKWLNELIYTSNCQE